MKKRGQASVISTVLLILLTVVVIVLIVGFVIPFVKKQLSTGDCLDVVGNIELGTGYSCYDSTNTEMKVQVRALSNADLIEGVAIEFGGGNTDSVKITDYGTGFSMDDGSLDFELPGDNEARVYAIQNVDEKPSKIAVYPILKNGKLCQVSDVMLDIEDCLT